MVTIPPFLFYCHWFTFLCPFVGFSLKSMLILFNYPYVWAYLFKKKLLRQAWHLRVMKTIWDTLRTILLWKRKEMNWDKQIFVVWSIGLGIINDNKCFLCSMNEDGWGKQPFFLCGAFSIHCFSKFLMCCPLLRKYYTFLLLIFVVFVPPFSFFDYIE